MKIIDLIAGYFGGITLFLLGIACIAGTIFEMKALTNKL